MTIMASNDIIHMYKFKNKATSIIKTQQIFSSLALGDVEICLRDGPFKSDIGINILHSFRGTHWVI